MKVILLERVAKLGHMGEIVNVKPGFARNFLLPRGKALRSTAANEKRFEAQRAQLVARNAEQKAAAEALAEKVNGLSFTLIRQAGESGQLYGSVSARDISDVVSTGEVAITRSQVELQTPIKTLGLHTVALTLHPEVEASVTINVARSPEEAERQARGEAATTREETSMDDLGLEIGAALAEAGPNAEL
jgi:large subunit ribosomal protein L9